MEKVILQPRPVSGRRLVRVLLAASGVLCVALAVIGIIVPVLPTTPFLLLAAACFMRSSERLRHWLLENRVLGEYIRRYRAREGLPPWFKVMILVILWGTMAASSLLAVPADLWFAKLLLLGVGLGVTIHIIRIKTYRSGSL